MGLIPVRSSAISAVGYDPASRQLHIRFTSHATVYTFCGVPQSIYDGLMHAGSKGTYYDQFIRDRYQC